MAKQKKKNKRLKLWLSALLLIVLVVITMSSIFKDFELATFINVISEAKLRYIFISLAMVGLYIFFESFAFKIVMKSLKHKITWRGAIAYSSCDYFFSGITPSATGGQPFQVFYMKKDGVPIHKSTIGILLNTIMYKMVLMVLGLFAVCLFPDILTSTGTLGTILFILGFSINVICVVACFMAIYWKSLITKIGHFVIRKLVRFKVFKNADSKIEKFDKKMDDYSRSAHYLNENRYIGLKLFIVNLLQRVALFSITYFVYRALVPASSASFLYLISIQIIVALCVDSMPFPGGTGLSELLLSTIYSIVYFGSEKITSALLLTRGINFYFALLLTGLIVLVNHIILMGKHRSRIDIHEEIEEENEKEVLQ